MSRILHVEDEPEWTTFTRRALADHRIDCAGSFDEALDLLRDEGPYDLALVDLHLTDRNDLLGGEILDLLKVRYPSTRRIVVTGSPPKGPVRTNIFERYGVEEIIIKGELTLPDLRRVVEEALGRATAEVPQEVKLWRSELRQRLRDWRRESVNRRRPADAHPDEAHRIDDREERFRAECAKIEARLTNARNMQDAMDAMEELERLEAEHERELGPDR